MICQTGTEHRSAVRPLGITALLAIFAGGAHAQDAALIEAAKREGSVIWYTTQPIDPLVLAATSAFQQKYGIKVGYVRANSTDVAMRIINEGKAGRMQADVFDGTTTAEPLKKNSLAVKWTPQSAKDYPPAFRDPEGYWVATNNYVIAVSFNTNLIKPGTEPKSWEELLDPRYRGQILWSSAPSTSAGPGFVGTVLKEWGEEKGMAFLKRLAGQNVAGVNAASRVVANQIIAGEYAIALQSFPENAIFSASRGAPIQWIAMKPAMTAIVSTIGLIANSPNPNAGKLLVEFLCGEEGQRIYRDTHYIPAHPKVPPLEAELTPGKHRLVNLTPSEANDAMPRWAEIYKQLFR